MIAEPASTAPAATQTTPESHWQAVTGVWEITMGCNMTCKHCGSGCKQPLPDELTTDEAMKLCDEIIDLKLKWITLSGGEPLMRKDWPQIVAKLAAGGVIPNLITNGWLMTPKIAARMKANNIGTVAISLDGLRATHDHMRQEGSFDRVIKSLQLLSAEKIYSGIITTVNTLNLKELPEILRLLLDMGVNSWQLQIGLPMGNLQHNRDLVLPPEAVDEIIDFCYDATMAGGITVFPADCLGYYNLKELEVRRLAYQTPDFPLWQGCNAGKRSLGILHNGEILGCTSIRDREFIEGSIRERPLRDIWNNPNGFHWSRGANKAVLKGTCQVCQFGASCLGGCPNTRLTMNGNIQSDNQYCSYHNGLAKAKDKLTQRSDTDQLMDAARILLQQGQHQLGALTLERLLELKPKDPEALRNLGFAHFFLENYDLCIRCNQEVLAQLPNDVYANKGMGLALHKSGKTAEGLKYLELAVRDTDAGFMDPYYDMAVVYMEIGQAAKAQEILAKGRALSPAFGEMAHNLEQHLKA